MMYQLDGLYPQPSFEFWELQTLAKELATEGISRDEILTLIQETYAAVNASASISTSDNTHTEKENTQ